MSTQVFAEDHHRQFLLQYKSNLKPKAHWSLHLATEMQLVGPPRDFSTIRFEGSYSQIKQKTYFNFLNLPLTVANLYAYRESYNKLYSSPALYPGVKFSSPRSLTSVNTNQLHIEFPNDSHQYTVSSVSFHGTVYKPGDIASFYPSGIVFHKIVEIFVSFSDISFSDTSELENTYLACHRLEYYYEAKLNRFRILPIENETLEIFNAEQMTGFGPIALFNNCIYPSTIGRIPWNANHS